MDAVDWNEHVTIKLEREAIGTMFCSRNQPRCLKLSQLLAEKLASTREMIRGVVSLLESEH